MWGISDKNPLDTAFGATPQSPMSLSFIPWTLFRRVKLLTVHGNENWEANFCELALLTDWELFKLTFLIVIIVFSYSLLRFSCCQRCQIVCMGILLFRFILTHFYLHIGTLLAQLLSDGKPAWLKWSSILRDFHPQQWKNLWPRYIFGSFNKKRKCVCQSSLSPISN